MRGNCRELLRKGMPWLPLVMRGSWHAQELFTGPSAVVVCCAVVQGAR